MLEKHAIRLKPVALLLAISKEAGVVYHYEQFRSIDSTNLLNMIDFLKKKRSTIAKTIFWDNASMHRALRVKEKLEKSSMRVLYNAPYSPEYHSIERVFSLIKRRYRQLVIGKNFDLTDIIHLSLIRKCVEMVPLSMIKKCIEKQEKQTREFLIKYIM